MNRPRRLQVSSVRSAVTILITLILVLSPIFSSGCGATGGEPPGENSQGMMLTLTSADNGKSIAMQVNDILVVSLGENPTTGFQWSLVRGDLVALQASEYIPATGPGVGGSGQRVLTFKAQQSGTGQLQLKRWREWEGENSVVERFTLTLQVRE